MKANIFNTIKVSALAVVLSVGLSYVYAWTAPTTTPPAGNVSAPINTGGTAQTKAGALVVGSLNAGSGDISTTGNITGWNFIANSLTAASISTTGNISSTGGYQGLAGASLTPHYVNIGEDTLVAESSGGCAYIKTTYYCSPSDATTKYYSVVSGLNCKNYRLVCLANQVLSTY